MITRINHFEAKKGLEKDLFDFLQSIIALVEASPGCVSCQLLRSTENRAQLAIIEEWESVAAHQSAAKSVPPDKMQQAMALFAKPPTGAYYQS